MLNKEGKHNHYIFYVITVLTVILAFIFLSPFISLIILSVLTVSLFNPIFFWLSKKVFPKYQGLAVSTTVLIISAVILLPTILFIILTINQLQTVSVDVTELLSTRQEKNLDEYVITITNKANETVDSLGFIDHEFTEEEVRNSITNLISGFVNYFLALLSSIGSSLGNYLTYIVIYIMLLFYIFPNQQKLTKKVVALIPLDDKTSHLYLEKIISMARSMITGTLVIAIIQGVVAAISLSVAGVPYAFFFSILFIFLSIIPLGSGAVALPIGIALLFLNNIVGGIIVLFVNGFIVTNIDNFLRPKLVSKDVKLPEVFILVAIFAGVEMFGFIGFIYGPVIMIFIFTTINLYINKYNLKSIN